MSANFIVEAEVRTGSGTAPVVVRDVVVKFQWWSMAVEKMSNTLLVDHNKIMLQLEVEAFHSALVQLHVGDDLQRAILRDVQMHPYKATSNAS